MRVRVRVRAKLKLKKKMGMWAGASPIVHVVSYLISYIIGLDFKIVFEHALEHALGRCRVGHGKHNPGLVEPVLRTLTHGNQVPGWGGVG